MHKAQSLRTNPPLKLTRFHLSFVIFFNVFRNSGITSLKVSFVSCCSSLRFDGQSSLASLRRFISTSMRDGCLVSSIWGRGRWYIFCSATSSSFRGTTRMSRETVGCIFSNSLSNKRLFRDVETYNIELLKSSMRWVTGHRIEVVWSHDNIFFVLSLYFFSVLSVLWAEISGTLGTCILHTWFNSICRSFFAISHWSCF